MTFPKYQFRRGVPALHTEIYLPKKSGFQGALFAALTDGRRPEVIRKHLTRHLKRVKEILRRDWRELTRRLDRDFIDELAAHIDDIFTGYSMYEVDGVYFAPGSHEPSEVRTQVIRLIFEYRIDDTADDDLVREIRDFLRARVNRLAGYTPRDPAHVPHLRLAEEWVERVGVFLFGFILHRIELAIADNPDLRQEEIWVASLGDAVVNKFVPERE